MKQQQYNDIYIKGARMHNLKNVHVSFPRNKLIVVTGVSGSGKSSLTIDTLFAEGQRKYAESLSAYIRQFMSRMPKPDVDYISGLCPAIAIEQKVISKNARSTVGSMTELDDYFRLLFAKIGETISPISGRVVKKHEVEDVWHFIQTLSHKTKIYVLVEWHHTATTKSDEQLNTLLQKGFARIYAFNKEESSILSIETLLQQTEADRNAILHNAEMQYYILVDRFIKKDFTEEDEHRIADSVQTAFTEGDGSMLLALNNTTLVPFYNKLFLDGISFEEPIPNLFSSNSPYGACPTCEGFGHVLGIDKDLVIPDTSLSVYEGAVQPWKGDKMIWWKEQFIQKAHLFNFPIHKPIDSLSPTELKTLWKGNEHVLGIDAFFDDIKANTYKIQFRVMLSRYRGRTACHDCDGYKLRKEALYVKIGGKHIGELLEMSVKDLKYFIQTLSLTAYQQEVAKRILQEIMQRLHTLCNVGLGYLTLNRLASTLSGGESQRIQLTRSLGSTLTNSLYILDEPSIGLHPRDTYNLIKVLKELRDLDNTVIVVEHDEMMMKEADYIVDVGPLASYQGGEIVATGTYEEILQHQTSLTAQYLRKELQIDRPEQARKWTNSITIHGASQNNLKNIDVTFPLNVFCVVSGVSGSGKTTLVKQILYPALSKIKHDTNEKPGKYHSLTGNIDAIDRIELVDQNPIGKSSRSNPVTYIKAYDEIRALFAAQKTAQIKGFQPKHFSFNVDAGRCEECKGEGEKIVEMQFLADVHLTCDVCKGKKFKDAVLEVTYKGKNIFEVLSLSVDEAIAFFEAEKKIVQALQPLQEVGLGYIQLGQSSSTLSGGEAQRVKLASFLGKGQGRNAEKILFIFDEPTTGLHFHDIKKLLKSMNALIHEGHSIIVIEHNTDVIAAADWVIDLGKEAGDEGGNLIFAGLPKNLKNIAESYTGQFL